MLVALTIENWRSFNGRERFDLTASRERRGSDTLAKLTARYGTTKILPMAAIFGANASGKTNLLDALDFMKYLVVDGVAIDRPIPVDPYRLSPDTNERPTFLEVEVLVDERIYVYGFSVTRKRVVEEHLLLRRTRSTEAIFARSPEGWELNGRYDSDRNRFITEGTRDNQLFLHNAVSQNADDFRPVYDWFAKRLEVVGIEAQYGAFYMMLLRDDFREFIDRRLRRYGAGISRLLLHDVPRESLNIPNEFLEECLASASEDDARFVQLQVNSPGGSEIYVINMEGDEPVFQKVQLAHLNSADDEVPFNLSRESMGTQRLVKLLPLFFELASDKGENGKVYVVDELDRSFHTALTYDLVRLFLEGCSSSTKKQLIFTTHDLLLMRHPDIRRDEQWVAENFDNDGTRLVCIGTHGGVRTDTSLLKAYQDGLLGGYPRYGNYPS